MREQGKCASIKKTPGRHTGTDVKGREGVHRRSEDDNTGGVRRDAYSYSRENRLEKKNKATEVTAGKGGKNAKRNKGREANSLRKFEA